MPKIFNGRDIFGKRVYRADEYEIRKNGNGTWEIVRRGPFAINDTYYGLWDKTPCFPNMMQAVKFLKENWSTMM